MARSEATRTLDREIARLGIPALGALIAEPLYVLADTAVVGNLLGTNELAGLAVAREPERLTTEFLKRERRGRVFVDWLRSTPTATVVVPFSLRPLPGAPVAVPLRWSETADAVPAQWGRRGLEDRLQVETARAPRPGPVTAIVEQARAEGVDLDTPFDRVGCR